MRGLSDDLDNSSNPASPLKLSPRGHKDPSTSQQDAAEDTEKDDAGGSDEVCLLEATSRVSLCQAFFTKKLPIFQMHSLIFKARMDRSLQGVAPPKTLYCVVA